MKLKQTVSCLLSLAIGITPTLQAQTSSPAGAAPQAATTAGPVFSQGELEAMLAPVALYPDALLSQILMASTYPLEIVEAARWRKANAGLKDQALQDALTKQTWDESVKSLTAFPDVLDRMNQDLAWTQKLGDAFLGQQAEVLASVQTLRAKAQAAGNLQSNAQQKVEVQQQDNKQYIVIQPTNPEVIYVPTYQPTVVYGAWGYPAYPPYYPPYWAPVGAAFVSGFFWGVGIAAGAALWGGCNWGRGSVDINVNRYNSFNRTTINNSTWNHNVNHRGAVPYRDAGTRDRYQANDRQAAQAREQFRGRDDSLGGKGLNDRAGLSNAQRDLSSNRPGTTPGGRDSAGTRDFGGAGNQAGTRDLGGAANRSNAGAGTRDTGAANRASASQRDGGGAFTGGNGAQTRQAADRGRSSMSSAGASRGGGAAAGARSGGGGARGGGGRR